MDWSCRRKDSQQSDREFLAWSLSLIVLRAVIPVLALRLVLFALPRRFVEAFVLRSDIPGLTFVLS